MNSLKALEGLLGYTFQDLGLLRLALTHPSVSHESPGILAHNQRLEFLGDSVLGLVLTRELYDKFPLLDEGPLTKARAHMVNRRTLASQARRFELGRALVISRGEEAGGGRDRPSALADAFEAVIGAIFLDGGYPAAEQFVLRAFRDSFGELKAAPNLENPKGELQELLQADSLDAPEYRQISVSGPDHDRMFECAVYHGGVELGRGQGKSKKEAEGQAAVVALEKFQPGHIPRTTRRRRHGGGDGSSPDPAVSSSNEPPPSDSTPTSENNAS